MDVSLIIRLIDQVTQPARKVGEALQGIGEKAGQLQKGFAQAFQQGFSVENVDHAIAETERKFGEARSRLVGAIGMATALGAPIARMADFEERLTAFGNTAGIVGDGLASIEDELRALAPQVNRSAGELLTALEYLVGKGLSPDEGLAALRAVGRTATATGAEVEDMAASGFAVLDNLKVKAEDLQRAYDAMAASGKAGGFELRGMAQYFPQLTASAQALGMDGVDAVAELGAALQIAMKGAGDEATAANNMQNFLSKLSSPETVKRFADMGVDLQAEFATAADKGVSVFEHMLTRIQEITAGDQFKMGELFGDQQVLAFLRPMIANMEEFQRIRDAALNAGGVNDADFAKVMETAAASMKALSIQLDNMTASAGPLLDLFKRLLAATTGLVATFNDFASANPRLAGALVTTAGALLGASIAMRALNYVVAGFRLGILKNVVDLFLKFGANGANVARGWTALAWAFGLLKWAAAGVGTLLAGITAPAWAVIAALAAAGFALWKYWERVTAFVDGFTAPFVEALGPVVQRAIEIVDGFVTKVGELLGLDEAAIAGFKASIASMFDFSGWVESARAVLADFWTWLGSFFSQEKLGGEEQAAVYAAGQKLGQAVIDGIRDYVASWIEPIRDMFSFSLEIDWPEPPEWLSWLVERAGAGVAAAGDTLLGNAQTGEAGWFGSRDDGPGLMGRLSNWWNGADEAADGIRAGGADAQQALERGGSAIAAGGQDAGSALLEGAAAIRAAASQLNGATSRAAAATGNLERAVGNARAGALHGGTE